MDDHRTQDPQALERIAIDVARETAALAMTVRDRAAAGGVGRLATKSSATDVVTDGDTACEELLRRRLAAMRPHDAVLGEEGGGGDAAPGQVRWVLDPIDGTVNYAHGLPWFAVSVGAEVDGRPIAGAVVEPVSGRVWSAARGGGARRDGVRLAASSLADPALAVVATGLNYDPGRRARQGAMIARLAGDIGDIRRTGCAALDLCAVAAGWVDAFYEHGLNAWDIAAGALIAQEAGALVRRPRTTTEGPNDDGDGSDGSDGGDTGDDGLGDAAVFAAGPALAARLTEMLRAAGARDV